VLFIYLFDFFIYVLSTRAWTQVIVVARHAPYYLSYAPSPRKQIFLCFKFTCTLLLLYWWYRVTPKCLYYVLDSPTPSFSFNRSHCSTFIYQYIILPPYSPYSTFLYALSHYTGTSSSTEIVLLSYPLFKKRYFCLFMTIVQGVSLWHFLMYIYYTLNQFIFSIFILSIQSPLWWFQQVWMFHIHTCTKHINSTHLLYFLHLSYPSH
jgi:hypothetical protein